MKMYFQLLAGSHNEKGVDYAVVYERDDKGNVVKVHRPVVTSTVNLVAVHGSSKFRQLSKQQAIVLLANEKTKQKPLLKPSTSEVAEAAAEGAAGLNAWEKDVTNEFPAAEACGLGVGYVKKDEYLVFDRETAEILTVNGPVSKDGVADFIATYGEM